jgi:DNA-binding NarL/FixJ family response regulator
MSLVLQTAEESAGLRDDSLIGVLVVDDHPAMRRGLCELLDGEPDLHVAAVASSAGEAMSAAGGKHLDVAVVDYHLPDRDGLWLSRRLSRLRRPPAVLIYSAHVDGLLTAAAVAAQAQGMLSKGAAEAKLCEAVRTVAGGGLVLPVAPWQVSETIRRRLDDREQAIYGMLVAGFPSSEIGPMLGLSWSEVDALLEGMVHKLKP